MVYKPVVLVLTATQLEGVSGNNTTRNLRIIIYTCYFQCYKHTHMLLSVFNANSFLPAIVLMRVTDFNNQVRKLYLTMYAMMV